MQVSDVLRNLQLIAPPRLAEEWDQVGLQLGHPEMDVRKVAAAVSPSPRVLNDCADRDIDLLVVHRPLFSEPVRSLALGTPWGEALCRVVAAGMSVYVLNTSYDLAPGGPVDVLANVLELACHPEPLIPRVRDKLFKLAVFVPPEAVDAVRSAMADAGAGVIGDYSNCSFAAEGTGTFIPMPGAEPYSGEGIGKLAREKELRLEMLVPEPLLGGVIAAMLDAHPYEEAAYDIYPLFNEGAVYGTGRICDLDEPVTLSEIADLAADRLGTDSVRISGDKKRKIDRIAIHAGEGLSHIGPAAKSGADALISGDMGTLGFDEAERLGIAAVDVPARDLMTPGIQMLCERLRQMHADEDIEVLFLVP